MGVYCDIFCDLECFLKRIQVINLTVSKQSDIILKGEMWKFLLYLELRVMFNSGQAQGVPPLGLTNSKIAREIRKWLISTLGEVHVTVK
jgi:hypothetical protein